MQHPLLKPRYEVIADYPGNTYKVGQVLVFGDVHIRVEGFFTAYYDMYPAIFKKLQWWEHREVAEMPEWVNIDGKVRRVKRLEPDNCILAYDLPGEIQYTEDRYAELDATGYELYHFGINDIQPATESEYQAYLTAQTK